MSDTRKKLLLIVTHGPEAPELATLPFVMATTALAADIDVVIGLQGNGAFLAMRGMVEHVTAPGFPPLHELLQDYTAAGGPLWVCGTCLGARHIEPQQLVAGASIVGAATFVAECVAATNVLVY